MGWRDTQGTSCEGSPTTRRGTKSEGKGSAAPMQSPKWCKCSIPSLRASLRALTHLPGSPVPPCPLHSPGGGASAPRLLLGIWWRARRVLGRGAATKESQNSPEGT